MSKKVKETASAESQENSQAVLNPAPPFTFMRPVACNDNSRFIDVWELNEDGTAIEVVNQKDSQAEIDRFSTGLDTLSIIERFTKSNNPSEINAREGRALNREVELADGSKVNYFDAGFVSPQDTYPEILRKLKDGQRILKDVQESLNRENVKNNSQPLGSVQEEAQTKSEVTQGAQGGAVNDK